MASSYSQPVEIGLSLGSNLGDRLGNLQQAAERVLAYDEAERVAKAPVYETDPVGVKPEFAELKFLNTILIVRSTLPVEEWLPRLQRLEIEMGRVRNGDRNAPRPVDIDILYAGDALIDSGNLAVPHPRWTQRRFVVQPLADVRPMLVLPGQNLTVSDILSSLPAGEEQVRLFVKEW